MLGKKSGVGSQLKQNYPNIVTWHCLNHRLELAVGDVINDTTGINHFKIFMDKLYSVYSISPKNVNELAHCSKELDLQHRKIGRVLATRWVSSSFRTVDAVWKRYAAICKHYHAASEDKNRKGMEKQH